MRAREPRRPVHIAARMRTGSTWSDVYIHNMSSRGLLLESTDGPPPRSYIEIRRGTQMVVARVAWRKDGFFGVRAQDRLDIGAWVGEPRLAHKPVAAEPSGSAPERRIDPQRLASAKLAEKHERSKRQAAAFQFVVLVVAAAGVAIYAAMKVGEILSVPLAAVKANLP